jgi:hypothetical protein
MVANPNFRMAESELRATLRYLQEQIDALQGGGDFAGLTFSAGDMLWHNGSALANFAAGQEGYVLTSHNGAQPTWEPSLFNVSSYAMSLLGAIDAESAQSILEVDEFAFEYGFDAGAGSLVAGQAMEWYAPFDCTLFCSTILTNAVGSIVFDVKTCSYAGYAASLTSIVASAPPTVSGARKAQDQNLAGWTLDVDAGNCIQASISSVSGLSRAVLALEARRRPT